MDQQKVFIAILGMSVVTYLPRLLPAWLLSGRQLPPLLVTWLSYVPPAVMAALLVPSLLMWDGQVNLLPQNLYLWAALPTLLFAIWTRNFFGTVVLGSALVALGRYVA